MLPPKTQIRIKHFTLLFKVCFNWDDLSTHSPLRTAILGVVKDKAILHQMQGEISS